MSSYVFLTQCADFSQAQVVKSFLTSQGFHPKVRDEQMRTVTPHLETLLGKLIVEVPEHEFLAASAALEELEKQHLQVSLSADHDTDDLALEASQKLAKKCLMSAILGCLFIPVIGNLYSMILGWRVLKSEFPLSKISRTRLLLAILFNSWGFYIWLVFGFKYFLGHL
ncbi:MAG: hypothetical protein ACM3MG_08760 [Bacillota bacterium]